MDFDEEFKESQRVAELASHLLKTGTAASSAEAEKRAREMIYGSVAAPAKPAQESAVKTNSDEYIKMIETSHNLIMKELAAIKYKQDQFVSEIISLRSELNKIQIQAAAASRQIQAPAQITEPKAEASRETKQDAAPAAQPAPQAVPKKTNPDDISIEKYFYFGQKK